MCGCCSASHVSCIPHNQGLAAGWGPLSHSNGCNLIHNQGFTHIIAITVSCQPSLRCLQDPSQVSVLGTHSVHCCRGRGNIQNHAFVPSWHLNDCWSWSLWNVVHCIVTEGAITRGWKLDILGTSWAATPPLLHCAAGAGGANSPTYRYLSVKDAKENTLAAGWAGAGCRSLQWIYRKR